MEKAKRRTRDIKFKSLKNKEVVCVHSQQARDYAAYLEIQDPVESYETNYPLDMERFAHVNPVGIRNTYFQMKWTSDFYIHYVDGRIGVRELTTVENLKKQAVIEKLELSRRYWSALDVAEWKVVIQEGTI